MKTICFITNHITGNFHQPIIHHLVKRAKESKFNLLIYGTRISTSTLKDYKSNEQIVYNFVNPVHVDGLIISTGSMLYYSSFESTTRFINKLRDIPLVSLYSNLENTINICTDNKIGIINMVNHLYKEHGYTKIAFVKGMCDNIDFAERLSGYLEGLEINGLSQDKNLIFQGNQQASSGIEIMTQIVKEKLDIESIIFSNDEMALGALEFISKEHPNLINKYAITGFDNVANGALTNPPLTTISQPMETMIDKSLDILLGKIKKNEIESNYIIPSELNIRSSCGCNKIINRITTPYKLVNNIYRPLDNLKTFNLKELYNQLTILLRKYKLNSCFISLYSEPFKFNKLENVVIPEKSYLKYSFYRDEERIYNEEQEFISNELLPREIELEEPFLLVAKPLYFHNELFGAIVHDATDGYEEEWENIRDIISNNIKGYNLIEEKNNLVKDLNEALNQVNQLKGLLPICANCKKIRDDKGYWNKMEKYISMNSEAEFTHSICPECAKKIYDL